MRISQFWRFSTSQLSQQPDSAFAQIGNKSSPQEFILNLENTWRFSPKIPLLVAFCRKSKSEIRFDFRPEFPLDSRNYCEKPPNSEFERPCLDKTSAEIHVEFLKRKGKRYQTPSFTPNWEENR